MGGDLEFDTNIGGPDDDDDDDENGEEGVSGSDGYSDDMPREGGFKDDEDDLEVDKGVKA